MRSYWIRGGPAPRTGVLIRVQRHLEKAAWGRRDTETGVTLTRAKELRGYQKPQEAKKGAFPTEFGGTVALPTPRSRKCIPGLPNGERKHFCRFQPPSLWSVVTGAPEASLLL